MSVISPFGLGAGAFTDGVRAGRSGLSDVDPEWDVPQRRAGVVDGFNAGEVLGETKNLRILGRAAGLATGAVHLMAKETDFGVHEPGRRSMVLGGHLIGTDRGMGLTVQSMTNAQPFHVDTKEFPSSVMNHSAAQCAIRHKLQGPNTTVTSGRASALTALGYARRMHAQNRADMVLVAGVEDLNPQRSWLTYHGHGKGSTDPLGEGCCVFLTESPDTAAANGRSPVGEVLAVEFGVAPNPDGMGAALAKQISRALHRAGVGAQEVRMAVVSGPSATAELAAVNDVLGSGTRVLEPASLIGDTDGASAAFQLATAIAHAPADGELAIVTSADADGQVGCGVFRVFGP